MKGDGEILEEIVSQERHKEINKVRYMDIQSEAMAIFFNLIRKYELHHCL